MTTSTDRLRALALLLVAFLCGAAVGVVADRAWWHPRGEISSREERRAQNGSPGRSEVDADQIPTPLERLDLSPEEQQRLHAIARRWRPQAQAVIVRIRPIVSDLENDMFAEMLCAISKDKQDRYLGELRRNGADSVQIAKRFRLVRANQCPAENAERAP